MRKEFDFLFCAAFAFIAVPIAQHDALAADNGAYKEQMRAYHAKLLAYEVQPGRCMAQRAQICSKLKYLTSQNQNVDALWAKLDAIERRARGTDTADTAYTCECITLLKEVLDQFGKNKSQANPIEMVPIPTKANDEAMMSQVLSTPPRSGYQFNRRTRIWEELKRCSAQKKNISNHVQQFIAMDKAMASGNFQQLESLLTQLEDSLALPHNVKD